MGSKILKGAGEGYPGRISASLMVDYISQGAEGLGRVSTLTHSSTSRRPY